MRHLVQYTAIQRTGRYIMPQWSSFFIYCPTTAVCLKVKMPVFNRFVLEKFTSLRSFHYRRYECEATMPAGSEKCKDIARQLVEDEKGRNLKACILIIFNCYIRKIKENSVAISRKINGNRARYRLSDILISALIIRLKPREKRQTTNLEYFFHD